MLKFNCSSAPWMAPTTTLPQLLLQSTEWPEHLLQLPNFSSEATPDGDVLFCGPRMQFALNSGVATVFQACGVATRDTIGEYWEGEGDEDGRWAGRLDGRSVGRSVGRSLGTMKPATP